MSNIIAHLIKMYTTFFQIFSKILYFRAFFKNGTLYIVVNKNNYTIYGHKKFAKNNVSN